MKNLSCRHFTKKIIWKKWPSYLHSDIVQECRRCSARRYVWFTDESGFYEQKWYGDWVKDGWPKERVKAARFIPIYNKYPGSEK